MLDFGLFSGFELVTLCPNVAQPCYASSSSFQRTFYIWSISCFAKYIYKWRVDNKHTPDRRIYTPDMTAATYR